MCGIVGILGREQVADRLLGALKHLEYRGYDSAGIATLEVGHVTRRRAEGKLKNLEHLLNRQPLGGTSGIGHTRWATHGKPTTVNAHPHASDGVAVVHNGIIENFKKLRDELEKQGFVFSSETDSEVVAHLVSREMKKGLAPAEAVAGVLPRLEGAFALVFLFEGENDLLIAARRGSPLALGYGTGEMYLGSDAIALAPFTDSVSYLEDGDWALVTRQGAQIHDAAGARVSRPTLKAKPAASSVERGNHPHFMAKEIHEQPAVVADTLGLYLGNASRSVVLPQELPFDFRALQRVSIAACGTAYYAGLVARHWFEQFARLPVEIDMASEFRYRNAPTAPGDLAILVSQSGETADTLAMLRHARKQHQHIMSVVNVPTSTIARESDAVMPTLAGPEIGVASTKSFTCQLATLACLAIAAGRARGAISKADEQRFVHALAEVPRLMSRALALEPAVKKLARIIARSRGILYLGRSTSHPVALEGALKLKELTYIHAEGYAAGELKHGPIALIDETMPVIVVAPSDHVFEKTLSNMQEVAARGGRIILLSDPKGAERAAASTLATLTLPEMPSIVTPLIYAIPLQLIAYHAAVKKGTDVDKPRNLAKSVTVE